MSRSKGSRLVSFGLAAALCLTGCGDLGTQPDEAGGGNGGADTLSTYTDVRGVLQTKGCLSSNCHGASPGNGGLDLRTYASTIAGGSTGNTVVPGNSGASSLYTKTTTNPPFGSRMPLTGTPLLITQQKIIADWIDQGAENN
ncbi:MAG: hypothetical protein HKN20_00765 [Gemmatimonadetes bacterium]|nr:hypothetical protein [Gemmatimonadota bacterium]